MQFLTLIRPSVERIFGALEECIKIIEHECDLGIHEQEGDMLVIQYGSTLWMRQTAGEREHLSLPLGYF